MRLLIAALLLISLATALPSDLIAHSPAPTVLDLQNVDPAAPKTLSAQNTNLSAFGLTELPDLGHYCSWANTETQTVPTLTDSQQGILTNNSTNDTVMIYL